VVTAHRVEELPPAAVVLVRGGRYVRVAPDTEWPWRSLDAEALYSDAGIQDALDTDVAEVLRCEAIGEGDEVPCRRPAVVVGVRGEVHSYLCNDDANRALRHGWSITSIPEVALGEDGEVQ
jgi:hypothetical protein